MGARHAEIFIAIWLAISWMIFHYGEEGRALLMMNDFICAFLLIFFALITYSTKFRHWHLMNFVIGLWLILFSYSSFVEGVPEQNYMTLGLLLLMLAIVPSFSGQAPHSWVEFMKKRY